MTTGASLGVNSGSNGPADSAPAHMTRRQSKEDKICSMANDAEALRRINPDFEQVRLSVKSEFAMSIRPILDKRKNLVLRLGQSISDCGQDVIQKQDICTAIKFFLAEEIREGLISERDIERYCPNDWKRKYNRKQRKSDNLSLSAERAEVTGHSEVMEEQATTALHSRESAGPANKRHSLSPVNNINGGQVDLKQDEERSSLMSQLAEKDATIARQQADIEALKHEKSELQEQLARFLIKPASDTYAHNPGEMQKRPDERPDLHRPFVVHVEMDVKGQFLPVIARVDPIAKKVTVVVDDAKARSMMG